jgi:hypothetical protein
MWQTKKIRRTVGNVDKKGIEEIRQLFRETDEMYTVRGIVFEGRQPGKKEV